MQKFIIENKTLTFMLIVSFIILLVLKYNINYLLILIVVSTILSMFIDKIGHLMQYISLTKLENSLNDANLKLKKSEKLFRDFFTQTNIPMCIFNLETLKFVKVNTFLCDLLEYNEEELLEKELDSLIHPEDLSESILVARLNRKKLKQEEYINRYFTKSGKIIKLKWSFTESDEDGISYCVALPIN